MKLLNRNTKSWKVAVEISKQKTDYETCRTIAIGTAKAMKKVFRYRSESFVERFINTATMEHK